MQLGLFYSILFHMVLIALLFFGLPKLAKPVKIEDYAMVVDVVKTSELTNVKVRTTERKDQEEMQTKKSPKSQQSQKVEAQPIAKQEDAKKVEEEVEKIPLKTEQPKKVEEKKIEPPKKKPEEAPKKHKKDEEFEKSILKSLEEESKKKTEAKVDKSFKELEDSLKGDTNKEFNDNLPLSLSEIDALKSQITRNWNTASFNGAASKGMQVTVVIHLDAQGVVLSAVPELERNESPYYRAFVDSAVRAVKMSSPLKNLDKEKFNQWKDIELRFDSEGMIY
ncbi:MAG: hypothetical protein ACHP6I_00465 [Rickettsiales bacterium]